jgi:hypothetical protein
MLEVKEDDDTPDDIVFVVIKFIAPEDAVVKPLGVELKAKALLATGVTSKLLYSNLLNAIIILHTF